MTSLLLVPLLLDVCFSLQAAQSESTEAKCVEHIPVKVAEGEEVYISVAVEEEEGYYDTWYSDPFIYHSRSFYFKHQIQNNLQVLRSRLLHRSSSVALVIASPRIKLVTAVPVT